MKKINQLTAGLILSIIGTQGLFAAPVQTTTSNPPPAVADAKEMKSPPAPDAKDMQSVAVETKPSTSPVQFRIGVPLWSSAVSGSMGVRGHVSSSQYISFTDLWNHLDYVIPISMEAQYGKWGILVAGQYQKLGDKLNTRDVIFNDANITFQQAFYDLNISYRVVDTGALTIDPFVGTRFEYVELSGSASSRFAFVKDRDESGSKAWADPILGVKIQYQVLKALTLVAKADVGGFGAASHLTYQAYGGSQLQITRNFYSALGYRYMQTNYSSGGFTWNMAYSGPQITLGVNF